VGDAARSAVLASESLKTKEVAVNITGERYTIREVAGVVKKLLPDAQLKVEDGSWGYDLVFDATAAEREIGYRPTTSIENGIRQNINKVRVANNLKPI
jgi:nucleoside-diphosphate-sugar epimerase